MIVVILFDDYLMIRAIESKDNEMLREMINDPEVERNIVGWNFPLSEVEQAEWFNSYRNSNTEFKAVIAEIETDISIGFIGLSDIDWKNRNAEIHIKMNSNRKRMKGAATSATRLLLSHVFNELGLEVIIAEVLSHNEKSQALFKRIGFVHEGTNRSRVFKGGRLNDIEVYSLKKSEYFD